MPDMRPGWRVAALPEVFAAVRAAGFAQVEVDLRGFRSGSMNEALPATAANRHFPVVFASTAHRNMCISAPTSEDELRMIAPAKRRIAAHSNGKYDDEPYPANRGG